jgi:predicted nucleic acid-binding protein
LRKGEPLSHVLAAGAAAALAVTSHAVSNQEVFRVVQESPLSAYDAEFVALARRLGCPLLTTDRQILDHYPDLAMRLRRPRGG